MIKEDFAKFFEEPTREGLRDILKHQTGEHNEVDFKEEWPSSGKLAKHILALTNYGGGCLVIGVSEEKEQIESVGVKEFKKKEDVYKEIDKFLPKNLINVSRILDFQFTETEYASIKNKKFQVLLVPDLPKLIPFVSPRDGEGIKRDRIYTRRGTQTIEASYDDIQKIINRRIDTGYSSTSELDLEAHLMQLKLLYNSIEQYYYFQEGGALASWTLDISEQLSSIVGKRTKKTNVHYPEEGYDAFINSLIKKKKKRIELDLDVLGIE
ncbi:putative transcriptional regulator [Planococcus donghaensis MPA1U2]|uniref:Putative transcriptional regulator n=1 Tax=Planococcus donghaensis MPA1U2 TaxID=933115 RepID=E7RKK8_9BACL|nr:ATP-binding protein [Planococcus donghaensis]EGA88438.1 putative transcriptional regulator [Planococcus donghaensis MPA1U2]